MSTITRSRSVVKSRTFTCSFISINVAINDTRYAVDPIDAGEFGTKAFRLAKHSGDHSVYDVIRQNDGIVACDCPDYEARHRGNGYGMCKHGRALVELGLMPAPIAPEFLPTPSPAVQAIPEPVCCDAGEPVPCQACVEAPTVELPGETVDPWDAEAPAELWPEGADDHLWNLGPEPVQTPEPGGPTEEDLADYREWSAEADARDHLDHSERLTLAELVDRQADFYTGWDNPAGRMLAKAMTALALQIRMTSATTPDELEARVDSLEADARAQWEAIGYDRAMKESGERAACLGHFGHSA